LELLGAASFRDSISCIAMDIELEAGTLNTTGRETPQLLLTSGLEHGPWRHAAANKLH